MSSDLHAFIGEKSVSVHVLRVDGKKMTVKLVIRDDKTDPNVTASNTESLISRDKAVAMLGSCTPALVNAGALVAERRKVPLVAGCDPLQAFKSVRTVQDVVDALYNLVNEDRQVA